MSPTARALLAPAIATAVCLGLFVTAVVVLMWDGPPPDDGDLRPVRKEIADAENAYTYFLKAIEALDLPKSRRADGIDEPDPPLDTPSEAERWDRIVDGEAWDEALARTVLARNEAALALWQQGLGRPEYQRPEYRRFTDLIPDVYEYFSLANLALVRSRYCSKRGDLDGATADAMRLVRFGHRTEESKGCLVVFLVGMTLRDMGFTRLRDIAAENDLSTDRLRALAADLAPYATSAGGFADALRAEYVLATNTVDELHAGETTLEELFGPLPRKESRPGETAFWTRFLFLKPVFKPNRTKTIFARYYRSFTGGAGAPYSDVPQSDIEKVKQQWMHQWVRHVASGNVIGRMLVTILMPAVPEFFNGKAREDTVHAALRLVLALRAHEKDHGRLPTTLDALVPDYLDAVPRDPYDGRPMRYDPERRLVYSVGRDLEDDGAPIFWQDFFAAKRKERGLDGPDVAPEDFEYLKWEFTVDDLPDPVFPLDFTKWPPP